MPLAPPTIRKLFFVLNITQKLSKSTLMVIQKFLFEDTRRNEDNFACHGYISCLKYCMDFFFLSIIQYTITVHITT